MRDEEVTGTAAVEKVMAEAFEDVSNAYNGGSGCMCGCQGDYAYRPETAEEGGKERGYAVGEDEVSERKVKARFNKVRREAESAEKVFWTEEYYGVENNERTTVVYKRKAAA